MRILFFGLFGLLILEPLYGQIKITGKIATDDGKPIPAANVLLLNTGDTSLIKGCVANQSGEYEMNGINPGKYFLKYTAVGFRTCNSPVFELITPGGTKNFSIQIMITDFHKLKEVVVQAEKPLYQQQVYGTTVNVENSIFTKGSSVLQVLERSPGVYLDHHHNTIALNGKGGVTVMIDGKVLHIPMTQLLNLLSGMNADNIEKIELLTSPPARYDAEGDAGIINIVLKKTRKYGTTGSASLSAGYGWGEKAVASINLDHNSRKIDVYGSYAFSHDRGHENWYAKGSQNIALLGGNTSFDFWSEIRPVLNSHNASLGLEARVNAKTKIGSSINYNYSQSSSDIINRGDYFIQSDSFLQLNAGVQGIERQKSLITSFYVEKKNREGEQIDFAADYIYFGDNNPTAMQSVFRDKNGNKTVINNSNFAAIQRGMSNTDIHVGVGKLDFVRQLDEKVKLETGVKWTYTKSMGLSGIQSLVNDEWVSLLGKSSRIDMNESIGAVYASVNSQIKPSLNLIVGVRYENSYTGLSDADKNKKIADRKLGKFFPAIFLTKKLNEQSSMEFSYTRRISRPSYIDLASNITYNDPVSVFSGNPLLRPTITDNIKAGYNYRGYAFSVLLGRDEYPISRYQIVADSAENLIYISPQNLTYQNNLVFEIKLPWKIGKWCDMNYGFVGGWRQFKVAYTIQMVKKNYFDYSVYGNQSFKLPRKFSLEISEIYNSITYGGVNKVAAFGMVNAGVKKELNKNGGTLQLSVTDILRSMYINSSLGEVTDLPFSLRSRVNFNTESRKFQIVKLTYSRSLGNNVVKHERKEDNGSVEERDRIRKE